MEQLPFVLVSVYAGVKHWPCSGSSCSHFAVARAAPPDASHEIKRAQNRKLEHLSGSTSPGFTGSASARACYSSSETSTRKIVLKRAILNVPFACEIDVSTADERSFSIKTVAGQGEEF